MPGLRPGFGIDRRLPFPMCDLADRLFTSGNARPGLRARRVLVPFFGGIDVRDGRIEQVTGPGGPILLALDEVDLDRRRRGPADLPIEASRSSCPRPCTPGRIRCAVPTAWGTAGTGWAEPM